MTRKRADTVLRTVQRADAAPTDDADETRMRVIHEKVVAHLESLTPDQWSPQMWSLWKDIWKDKKLRLPNPLQAPLTKTSSVDLKKLLAGKKPTSEN